MSSNWELTTNMFLSFSEVDALLAHVRNRCVQATGRQAAAAALDRLIVESLLFSGLRTTEFCRLTLADTVIGTNQSVLCVTGLRGRDRTVHVPARVSTLVRSFVKQTRNLYLPENVDPKDTTQPLVFSERKNPYERSGLYRRVVRILTAAELGDRASVQLLRHTYGYLAYYRSGGNLLFVQRQLGHAHPMVTAIYAQFVDERYDDLAELVIGDA